MKLKKSLFFREGSVSVSQSIRKTSNPLLEAEYHKNVIVRDVARNFGRQDSSSAGEMLFNWMEAKNNSKESPSPESPTNFIDEGDQVEVNYMSPIVSLYLIHYTFNLYLISLSEFKEENAVKSINLTISGFQGNNGDYYS